MEKAVDLKAFEKKAFRSTFQDGLWDVFLGLILLAMATNDLLSRLDLPESQQLGILAGIEAAIVVWFILAKKRITVPRMGRVKFGPNRKRRLLTVKAVLGFSVLLGLAFFVLAIPAMENREAWLLPGFVLPAAWVLNCLLVFSAMAYFMDLPRLYVYAVLFALPVPVDIATRELTGANIGAAAFAVPGLIILGAGLVLLWRFLQAYPKGREEAFDAGSH